MPMESVSVLALHKPGLSNRLSSIGLQSRRGAGVVALLLILIVYSTVRHLLACAAAALLLVPVYKLQVRGGRRPGASAQRGSTVVREPPTRQQLIASCAARARGYGASLLHQSVLLLPSPQLKQNMLTVVLDLDETLVFAYRPHAHAAGRGGSQWQPAPAPTRASHSFELQCVVAPGTAERVLVYERPGLRDFLRRLSSFAEIVAFTAGLPSYAEPLVQAIDPEGTLFSACLYRGATVMTRSKDYIKDLGCLGRDLRRCVLVDNNPYSFLLQPLNGIPLAPYAGDPCDSKLLEVLLPLLYGLAHLPDVRPVLASKFRMPQWFASRGYDVWPCVGADLQVAGPM